MNTNVRNHQISATASAEGQSRKQAPTQAGWGSQPINWQLVRYLALVTIKLAQRGGLRAGARVSDRQADEIRTEYSRFASGSDDPRVIAAAAAAIMFGLGTGAIEIPDTTQKRQVASVVRYRLIPALRGHRVAQPPRAFLTPRQWAARRRAGALH